jgi:hypothetical protein
MTNIKTSFTFTKSDSQLFPPSSFDSNSSVPFGYGFVIPISNLENVSPKLRSVLEQDSVRTLQAQYPNLRFDWRYPYLLVRYYTNWTEQFVGYKKQMSNDDSFLPSNENGFLNSSIVSDQSRHILNLNNEFMNSVKKDAYLELETFQKDYDLSYSFDYYFVIA